jgi:hypothetical protein
MRRWTTWLATLGVVLAGAMATAQHVPQPFPRPGQSRPSPEQPSPQRPASTTAVAPPQVAVPALTPPVEEAPDADVRGVPVYPGARFLRSYDAGKGQRYYLYGVLAPFADLVTYYRSVLRTRGELVYDVPPVHMFEVGRFREDSMAFPPGVTIKDYTWGGYGGWLDPTPGAQPQRYPSIVQIVPVPPGERRR